MTLRIITVNLEDVFPIKDEYGNEYTSRDYTLKANQDYVRELAESMRAKGEPDEPIKLIQDGGIYYIKAGRSRYEAMKLLGTESFQAVVDDEDTVQSVLETVIRTDVKKKYEDVERSRYVQQLMMFGSDEYVGEVTGIQPEKVGRIRKARRVVDDAGDDLTLDRMLLIEEFADDPEAVKKLTECREADADSIAGSLRRGRRIRERQAAYEAAFGMLDVPCSTDRAAVGGMTYFLSAKDPASVADALPPEWEDGQVAVLFVNSWDDCRAEVYVSPELAEENDEQAELRRQEEAYKAAVRAMDADREAWFWANVAAGKPMPNLLREAERGFKAEWWVKDAMKRMPEEAAAAAENKGLSIYDYAIGFDAIAKDGALLSRALAKGEIESYRLGQANEYLDLLMLYQADGWDPGDARALIARLSEIVDGNEEEDEEEDD